jgi:general stress protein 26
MEPQQSQMPTADEQRNRLLALMKRFEVGILITGGSTGLHARPLAVASAEGGELWFATDVNSPKVAELRETPRVSVTFQSPAVYLAFTGDAEIVRDSAKVKELWREGWRTWFPKGPEDPDIALVRVDLDEGEYWNMTGTAGIRYLFRAAKSYVTGTRNDRPTPEEHGKVEDV